MSDSSVDSFSGGDAEDRYLMLSMETDFHRRLAAAMLSAAKRVVLRQMRLRGDNNTRLCTSVWAPSRTRVSTKRLGVAIKHRSTCPQDDPHAPPPQPSPRHPTGYHVVYPGMSLCRCHVDLWRYDAICRSVDPRWGRAVERFGPSRRFASSINRPFVSPLDGSRTDYVMVDVSLSRPLRSVYLSADWSSTSDAENFI